VRAAAGLSSSVGSAIKYRAAGRPGHAAPDEICSLPGITRSNTRAADCVSATTSAGRMSGSWSANALVPVPRETTRTRAYAKRMPGKSLRRGENRRLGFIASSLSRRVLLSKTARAAMGRQKERCRTNKTGGPAVKPGFLPGGPVVRTSCRAGGFECWTGQQDAALYGRDACLYRMAPIPRYAPQLQPAYDSPCLTQQTPRHLDP
jgi:hypothetical protein